MNANIINCSKMNINIHQVVLKRHKCSKIIISAVK
jgi:hypothetical protein